MQAKRSEIERVERSMKEKISGVILVVAIVAAIFLFTRNYGLGFPISESVGDNVYLLEKNNHSYKKGDLVAFLYQGKPFRDYKNGDKFLKFVGCDEGDLLTVTSNKYFCNGNSLGYAALRSSDGKPIKPFIYNGIIPKGYFFAVGSHPKSYDSRYWGLVNDKDIYAKATEIF